VDPIPLGKALDLLSGNRLIAAAAPGSASAYNITPTRLAHDTGSRREQERSTSASRPARTEGPHANACQDGASSALSEAHRSCARRCRSVPAWLRERF
jgi:hypothetical protein